jgi:hypothetical protein
MNLNPKTDYQRIHLLVSFLTDTTHGEKDYTYTTIDGFKAFKFACPICSPDGKKKNAAIFPKRMEDWKGEYPKRWFYLCKGESTCACKGLQSVNKFTSTYFESERTPV